MTGIGRAREPRARGSRRTLIATALVVVVVGILLLGGAWKLGWFGGKGKGTTPEIVFDLGGGVELTLCWCPPGKFLMGSPVSEAGRQVNEVQHEVTLTRGFWMAKTETTQGQWAALMPDNPSHFQGDRLPVENVTWDEAKAFAVALTERVRREGKLNAGWEFRLPTEAQWEYACRAGTTTAYFTGDGEEALHKAGWYSGNSDRKSSRMGEWLRPIPVIGGWFPENTGAKPRPAGKKEENAFGLQDTHGNVWEWCEDGYGAYGAGSVVDPIGPQDSPARPRAHGWHRYGNAAPVASSMSSNGSLRPAPSSKIVRTAWCNRVLQKRLTGTPCAAAREKMQAHNSPSSGTMTF